MEVSLSLRVVASVVCGHSIVFVVVVDAVFNITKSLPLNPPLLFPLLVGLCTSIYLSILCSVPWSIIL